MVIRRAGLESLFPRGGRRGRTQTMPNFDWSQLLSGATPDFPGPALVAPPGIGLQQPTVVRPTERRIRPLPIGEPIPFRPTIPAEQEPGRIRDLRPPGESYMDKIRRLKAQRQQLREQLRQIEAQIRSLSDQRGGRMDPIPWGPGGEPPMPVLPRPPRGIPIGPPTMPVTPFPTPIGPGTPIPQPPTAPTPWQPDPPPWGG